MRILRALPVLCLRWLVLGRPLCCSVGYVVCSSVTVWPPWQRPSRHISVARSRQPWLCGWLRMLLLVRIEEKLILLKMVLVPALKGRIWKGCVCVCVCTQIGGVLVLVGK